MGWELGGGERRKGGWKGGEEGRMAKLKADAERLFSWTRELFAGSGYQEHENVKQTWKMKPPFIHSSPPPPPNPALFPKGSKCCKWVVCLHHELSITGPFWLCAPGRV